MFLMTCNNWGIYFVLLKIDFSEFFNVKNSKVCNYIHYGLAIRYKKQFLNDKIVTRYIIFESISCGIDMNNLFNYIDHNNSISYFIYPSMIFVKKSHVIIA